MQVNSTSSNIQYIRCFDLGGGGLKTAVLTYDKGKKIMVVNSPEIKLGKCPDTMKVADWAREQLKKLTRADLDAEVSSGYRFGFSLAGLDKLRDKPVDENNMDKLFNLPSDKVKTIDDGGAHLLASLKSLDTELPAGRVWNFSIGTGVGFGFTNSKKELRPPSDLKKFFGKDAWEVQEPTTGQPIYKVGGAISFDEILAHENEDKQKAFAVFADRWSSFVQTKIIEKSKEPKKDWAAPAAIVFTGGHIDYHGNKLIKHLKSKKLNVEIFTGPKNAGLLGAAWKVVEVT